MHSVLREIGDAESPAELWRAVRRYFVDKGFRGLAYFAANRGGGRRGFHVIHHGFSRAVSEAYVKEGWGEKDPGPAIALSRGVPMRWSEMWQAIEPDEQQMLFLERMREAGLGDGYSFPVFGPAGRNGVIAVGRVVKDGVLETEPLDEMHIVAQAAYMRLCQMLPDRPLPKPLSARELEILDWVARGKSNNVIADILDLSGATVDTYLRRIYEKLDVSDRTSAAVRGVGMGLIAA